jgi:hypothetical protein
MRYMKSWFPVAPKSKEVVVDYKFAPVPEKPRWQEEAREHISLLDHVDKLATHNSTHGKNVVFWSCKRCNG